MFCKQKALKSACSSQLTGALLRIQRHILKGRNSKKLPHDESPELHSSCHTFHVLMVVSNSLEVLSYGIHFNIFLREYAPTCTDNCMLHMPHYAPPPSPITGSAPGFNQSDHIGCRQVDSEMTVVNYKRLIVLL